MTALQICAMASVIIAAVLFYWIGYRGGLADGRLEGREEGVNTQQAANAEIISELEASLQFIRSDHKQLASHCKTLKDTLGIDGHRTLLAIADKLRIAAQTFSAFPTAKDQIKETLRLREKALSLAAQIEPKAPEHAA
jgi:hypothetical protein